MPHEAEQLPQRLLAAAAQVPIYEGGGERLPRAVERRAHLGWRLVHALEGEQLGGAHRVTGS